MSEAVRVDTVWETATDVTRGSHMTREGDRNTPAELTWLGPAAVHFVTLTEEGQG